LGTDLSPGSPKESPGQCFVGAERFDLVWQDRKIAGAAQRRTRQGLLIQGSIQPPAGIARASWEKAFCDASCEQWGIQWQPFEFASQMEQRIRSLAREKYTSLRHNQRR